MGKENNLRTKSIIKNPYAMTSTVTTVASVAAYYVPGFFDRTYHLAPQQVKSLLFVPAAVAAIATVATIAAIVKVHGTWKIVFVLFFLLTSAICAITLMVASLIGSIG